MGKVEKEFSGVWGSFGRAVHVSSIVITAKNTPNNTDSGGDDVEEAHCVSSGSNTITLCTREEDGLYVNGMNLVATIKNLTAELEVLRASILPECIPGGDASRRRILTNCFGPTASPTTATPTSSPTQRGHTTDVGKILLADNFIREARGESAGFWSDEVLRVLFDNGITVPVQVCDRSNDAAIIEAVQTQITFLRELFGCDAVSPPPPIESVERVVGITGGVLGILATIAGAWSCLYPQSSEQLKRKLRSCCNNYVPEQVKEERELSLPLKT